VGVSAWQGIVVSPDSSRVYLTEDGASPTQVAVFSSGEAPLRLASVPTPATYDSDQIAITPDGNTLYVYGYDTGDVYVITTSRLVTKNAVDDMIRALPLLPENVSFVVLGTGPDEAALKKLATDLHVSERVKWLGQIGHADMPKYLKACDIFIRASRSEGMGNSFVEAMAAELPVVATQEGGIADFLFDEKRNPGVPITGWAVDKDSPREIAAAIRDIMDRPEKVRAVVKTAKEMVIEKYDWNLIAKDMREKVFGPLLNHEAR
jgi:glycosyltransferase involved in cell wall biosynthesis